MAQQVLDYPKPRRPSDFCTITYLRYALFSFTTILLMSSMVLLGLGVWTMMEKMDGASLLPLFYKISVYGVLGVGALVFFAGIVGCHGTIQEQYCSLVVFSVLLVLIFLCEVAVGVVSYILYTQIHQTTLADHMTSVFQQSWGQDEEITKVIDDIQTKYQCCGSTNHTEWLSNSRIQEIGNKVPDSCCISYMKDCGRSDHISNLHQGGCARHLEKSLSFNITLIPALTLGLSVIQIIGVIFSSALAHQISRSKKFIRRIYRY